MSGSTTELALSTAVDSDDNADYLTINLANSLRTLDGLFNNVTGHTHGGAHQGGPVAPAAGSITSAMIADGTIATADLANAAVTNAKLGTDTARANLLVNGGFEIWQRGNGPFTVSGAYSADYWNHVLAGTDTLSISRDTANVDVGSAACAVCTFVLGTGGGATLRTLVKDNFQLKGKTVSLSCRVKTSTANAVRLVLFSDGTGGTAGTLYSAFHSGGGAYETLTVTGQVPTNATFLYAMVSFNVSCTAYVDNAMLVVGSQSADYAPLHPADDLARCLRYYEMWGNAGNNAYLFAGQCYSTTDVNGPIRFTVRKAMAPTMTASGTFQMQTATASMANVTAFVFAAATPSECVYHTTVASGLVAGNASVIYTPAVTSAIIAEANP